MLDGVQIDVSPEAVVVKTTTPLRVVSSAPVGGGLGEVHAVVNLHVPQNFPCDAPEETLAAFTRRRGIPAPYVGLMTSAWTEKAELASEVAHGITALTIATVGLSNSIAAGESPQACSRLSTINTIIVVDAAPEPAALVNAVITATEAKALALVQAGIRCPDGSLATGTPTDAVVMGATGNGPRCRFGGPASELGWVVARAVKSALDAGIRRWVEDHP